MKSVAKRLTCLALILVLSPALQPAQAEAADPAARGLEIAREADDRSTGYGDYSAQMTMTLRDKNGKEAVREMRFKSLEVEGDGDKSLTLFDEPRDVEGTALLTYAHKVEDDDIWLFLPALKRVKRIAGNNKSGPFMGSEFAFEDFGVQEVEKFTYTYIGEETLDGKPHFVVDRDPVEKTSGYSRQRVWFDQDEYRVQKIDFFNKGEAHIKTLTAHGYQKYLDKYWFPDRYEMVNHDTGRSTTLAFSDYEFGNGFSDRDFDQGALKTAR